MNGGYLGNPHFILCMVSIVGCPFLVMRIHIPLARMFHELMSREHEDGCTTGQPQGVDSEAYLNGTSQGATPEDARKDGPIRGHARA